MYRPSLALRLIFVLFVAACGTTDGNDSPDTSQPQEVAGATDLGVDGDDIVAVDVAPDAETGVASLRLLPEHLDFGATVVGASVDAQLLVQSTGTAAVVVTGVYFDEENSSEAFRVAYGPDIDVEGEISPDNPLAVPANGYRQFRIHYAPTQAADVDPSGLPIDDVGILVVESESETPRVEMEVRGRAHPQAHCPMAVILCDEGRQVQPQTNLHLRGDDSYALVGEIRKWEWRVTQPVGSLSVFLPSSTFPNPTFEANVVGRYTFALDVWDDENTKSCATAEYEVVERAAPGLKAIHRDCAVEALVSRRSHAPRADPRRKLVISSPVHHVERDVADGPVGPSMQTITSAMSLRGAVRVAWMRFESASEPGRSEERWEPLHRDRLFGVRG